MNTEIKIITSAELEQLANTIIKGLLPHLPSEIHTPVLLTNQEASKYLNVCTKTMQNYRDNGLIRYTQIGRKLFYTKDDLNLFLSAYKKSTLIETIINKKVNQC